MSTESNGRSWLWNVSAGFLCLTGIVTLAMAAVHPAPTSTAPSFSGWVPPSMHVAEREWTSVQDWTRRCS